MVAKWYIGTGELQLQVKLEARVNYPPPLSFKTISIVLAIATNKATRYLVGLLISFIIKKAGGSLVSNMT